MRHSIGEHSPGAMILGPIEYKDSSLDWNNSYRAEKCPRAVNGEEGTEQLLKAIHSGGRKFPGFVNSAVCVDQLIQICTKEAPVK